MIRILSAAIFLFLNLESNFAQNLSFTIEPIAKSIEKNSIELQWETSMPAGALIEWVSLHTGNKGQIYLESPQVNQSILIDGLEPAEFIEVHVKSFHMNDTIAFGPAIFTSQSASTGNIKVYFNHGIEASAAGEVIAVNIGAAIDDTLIAYMNRAQSTMDIAIYNSSASSSVSNIAAAINAAHNRGVRVRIVYDASTTNTMLDNVNSAVGRIQSTTGFNYGIMHNKFVVIDANDANPAKPLVWTGSTNWTVAQLNGPDNNHVIIVQDQALARAYELEFQEMFGSTGAQPNAAAARFGPDKTDNTPHSFNVGGKLLRCYFSPSDGTNGQIISTINSANNDISFASMIITRNDISTAIVNKANAGIPNTYGITDDSTASPPAPEMWQILKSGLLPGRMISKNGISGTMHHKFVLVDQSNSASDPQILTGSHNWSSNAENRNDENTIIVHDPVIVNQFWQAFVWMFNTFSGGSVSIPVAQKTISPFPVFPNPVNDVLFFDASQFQFNNNTVEIMDVSGRNLSFNTQIDATKGTINVSALSPGVYWLNIQSEQGTFSARFLKYN
jgi:hypothetical protein